MSIADTTAQAADTPTAGPTAATAILPPHRRRIVFAIVAFALLMMSLDSTIVATALHTIQEDLRTEVNWSGWTITAYSLGFVIMLPITGKLSGHLGRRRVFLASVAVFTIASLLCGLAGNITTLIVLRALQAAGGAGFTPSATGIIVDHFGDWRDRAVGLFGSIFPIGGMIGPIFGGLFVSYWSWRGIFYVNLPIGLLVLALAWRFIPADPPGPRERRLDMDLPGMVLMTLGLLGGMLAAARMGEPGAKISDIGFVLPALTGAGSFALFIRHIARTPAPFIAPHLIHGARFGVVNLANALFGGMTKGAIALVPIYAAYRYGLDALQAGLLLIAQGLATIVFSSAAAFALRRTGHRLPVLVGVVTISTGLMLLSLAPPFGLTPWVWLALATFVIGMGSGTINPATRNAGLQLAPDQASTLAALRSASLQIGGIVTVSVVTAILAGAGDPGRMQAHVYLAMALGLIVMLPLAARLPEHHGGW